MIDLHAHILPGLDHGARDWDEAVEMARIAVADGIAVIAATPHVNDAYPNAPGAIEAAVEELRERLADAGVPLEVVTGGDYHIDPGLGPETVCTLGGNGRYFLLEFPYHFIPPNADRFVETLAGRGLIPIVTHPERIASVHRDCRRLAPLIGKGALVQLTAGSLAGDFGPEALTTAELIVERGWVHLLATDAHWADERQPVLSPGLEAAAALLGEAAARRLVEENPRRILAGEDL